MAPQLRERLSASFVRRLCQDRIEVHRAYVEADGMGGVTTTWRKLATIPARLINKSDSEQVIGDGVKAIATWEMLVHSASDIIPHDRVYIAGDQSKVYEVVGTDEGQTELLIQKVGLVERMG
jgi:head-tail adaptor